MATLLPPAAGEAARGRLLGAMAVTSHTALLIVATGIHLRKDVILLGDPGVDSSGAVCGGCGCLFQQSRLDGVRLWARL